MQQEESMGVIPMHNSNRRPILVTGSHRSGSTWAGRMLAQSPALGYIHEPFNLLHKPGICTPNLHYWYTYICEDNASLYCSDFERCFHFKYQFYRKLQAIDSPIAFGKALKDFLRFKKYQLLHKRPLIKDPLAVFSTEWLAKQFNMEVVVVIRHPAAFAGSLKRANWNHPFSHFLKQPLLMEHHLSRYRQEIEEYARNEKDIIDQAILLWNLIHHMIVGYRNRQSAWIFVRHEDLSANPMKEFAVLYQRLGLDFSAYIEEKIRTFCFADGAKGLKRDSKDNIWNWKKRLTDDEIKRIQERTQEISSVFYGAEDWNQ